MPHYSWGNPLFLRPLLDDFGKKHRIDNWQQWYNMSSASFHTEGLSRPLQYYCNSHSFMLLEIYPEYPWDLSQFKNIPKNFWLSLKHQRHFLDVLAKQNKF